MNTRLNLRRIKKRKNMIILDSLSSIRIYLKIKKNLLNQIYKLLIRLMETWRKWFWILKTTKNRISILRLNLVKYSSSNSRKDWKIKKRDSTLKYWCRQKSMTLWMGGMGWNMNMKTKWVFRMRLFNQWQVKGTMASPLQVLFDYIISNY